MNVKVIDNDTIAIPKEEFNFILGKAKQVSEIEKTVEELTAVIDSICGGA